MCISVFLSVRTCTSSKHCLIISDFMYFCTFCKLNESTRAYRKQSRCALVHVMFTICYLRQEPEVNLSNRSRLVTGWLISISKPGNSDYCQGVLEQGIYFATAPAMFKKHCGILQLHESPAWSQSIEQQNCAEGWH